MGKKVLISVGPIPARLDSVKFITNRFKGGLAIKTANYLVDKGVELTVVAWKFTDISGLRDNVSVVRVIDVYEYCDYIEKNANNFNAFIMAAAVANLSPTHPYEDKFPSHLYKVGDKFNIEFEIAPRAIDIVKKVNPRCCLIGYKLFDAKTDEELIEIARHTLHDSKANIIFANTPAEAKTRKIALMQDNTALEMSFDEHLQLIYDAISSAYFKTVVDPTVFDNMSNSQLNKIMMCKALVKKFESTLEDKFGTIAIRVSENNDFVTTARGHNGEPVYVSNIDIIDGTIRAEAKATLNAPALLAFMHKGYDYVIHRHNTEYKGVNGDNEEVELLNNYLFPGTIQEYIEIKRALRDKSCVMEKGHGYLAGFNVKELSWDRYYDIFGESYASYPDEIEQLTKEVNKEYWLDVGCNTRTNAEYVLDPNVEVEGKFNLTYDDYCPEHFELITLKNCINYLTNGQLDELITWLKSGGVMIANSFVSAPNYRVKDNEATYLADGIVNHYYMVSEQEVYHHTFKDTHIEMLRNKGFTIEEYNNGRSILIRYTKK